MTTAKQIKNLFAEYEAAHEAMLAVYTTEDEAIWDAASEAEAEAEMAFKMALCDFAGITLKEATWIMVNRSEKVADLVHRLAA